MNSSEISALAGVLLSLIFSYVPKVKDWFVPLDPQTKRLIMLGALVVSTLVIYGASCGNLHIPLVTQVDCNQSGAVGLFDQFILALIANQSTYAITPLELPKKVGG